MSEQETVDQSEKIQLTPEEVELLSQAGYGGSTPEKNPTVHAFLHDVAVTDDTTKLGNLTSDEVGIPKLPQRTYKELSLFCDKVANMSVFKDYFDSMAEILTSTSLSKDAKLLELAVVQRKEVANVTKQRKPNKGMFGFRKKETEES